jgi:hypothetical protein
MARREHLEWTSTRIMIRPGAGWNRAWDGFGAGVASWALLLAFAVSATAVEAEGPTTAVSVRFELNDAQVKGRALEGVHVRVTAPGRAGEIASGVTGGDGRWTARLPRGTYEVSYRLAGYVPYTSGATEINEEGQVVTVSLPRLLEATESGSREVRIILNWGSRPDQVRDADAHLACPCNAAGRHVYFQERAHASAGHRVELDVDDTDWGGPETVTISDPAPGSYLYWVHDYSGPPAALGISDVVVRVVIGAEQAGEFHVFKGVTRRAWRPFKTIEVSADGRPSLVRFTEDEIAEAADLAVPADLQPPEGRPEPASTPAPEPSQAKGGLPLPVLVGILFAVIFALRRARRGRPRSDRR